MKKEEIYSIRQAILMEVEGYEFYKIASSQFEGEEIKKAFLQLMDEEKSHAKWLEETFEKFKEHENEKFSLAFLENPPKPNIFDWEKLMTKTASIPLTVFGIALEMEKSSIEFYKKKKEETEDENLKKLYSVLEAWENTHYDQFDKIYNTLKEDWWNEQGYAPF